MAGARRAQPVEMLGTLFSASVSGPEVNSKALIIGSSETHLSCLSPL